MAGKKTSGNSSARTRNWTFIVYPESAPDGWENILNEEHLEWIKSPLHDKDINATGEQKKPHYHVLVLFQGVKTFEQVQALIKPLNCTIPTICQNAKALVRYMAHLDNPEKAQYSISDIVAYGGVDLSELLKANKSERYLYIKEMLTFIATNNITEFKDLMDYAIIERFDDWFPLLCDNSAYVVQQYIKSCRHYGQNTCRDD